MNFFSARKINEHITCIQGLTGEMMYLAEGTKRAALIDTGMGIGNIREYVSNLTSLPYDVLLTHGHEDHAAGGFLYDSVFISPKDIELMKNSGINSRKAYVKSMLNKSSWPEDTDYVRVREVEMKPLSDGDRFDLGGVTLEAIEVPGHTKGSITFLFREDRILLTGDACNTFTFLFLPECLSIEEYRKSLQRLLDRSEDYDRVLLSHGIPEVSKAVVQEVFDCCTDIMEASVDDVPFEFMGQNALIAKRTEQGISRADGKTGNIVYSKNHVFHMDNRA